MSAEVDTFLNSAERFCSLVESVDELSRHAFLTSLNRALPQLYVAALDLPDRFVDGPDPPDGISDAESSEVFERIRAKLGDADFYRSGLDPWDAQDELLDVSLADDVRDIYRELKSVLANNRGEEAAWDWRFEFAHHWGYHAARALNATHWLLHDPGEGWIDPDE